MECLKSSFSYVTLTWLLIGKIILLMLAVPKFSRELGRVSNSPITWHHHKKDRVKIGHLTKYDVFRLDRDQVMELQIWFKIHKNVSNFETLDSVPQNHITLKNCFLSVLKDAEIKITMFAHFKEYHGNHKKFCVYTANSVFIVMVALYYVKRYSKKKNWILRF